MDDDLPTQYEVIVVGTGLVECVVAAAAARVGKKVLHIDKNDYYGVQWASFTLKGAQQWVDEVTTTPAPTPPGDCELEEGEQLVGVANPSEDYSGVRQTWHVPKEPLPSPSPEPAAAAPVEQVVKEEGSGGESTQVTGTPDTPPATPQDTAQDAVQAMPQDTAQDAVEATAQGVAQEMPQADQTQDSTTMKSEKEESGGKKEWSQEELLNLSRKFNLDLAPKLLYSQGPMVELLISSNIARYVEFKCISRVLTWLGGDEGNLLVVPCSRSDVFTTSAVTLVEKRLLMKFLEFCHQYDRHPEQLEEHLDKPFVDFLRSKKLTDNLIHFVTEAIGMVGEGAGCKEGLERTRAFLTSLGRYGTTPFLFSMYGSGELPQAFCRLCAVFEGIYILRKPVSSLVVHSPSHTCRGLLSEGQRFTCNHLVMSASHAPRDYLPRDGSTQGVSRAVFLTDRSILPHEKEQLTLLRVPAKEGNPIPVTVLEVGPGTHVCPKDLYCVHMTCQGTDAESDLRVVVERLLTTEADDTSSKPRIVWSLYFNQVDHSGCDLETSMPGNLYLCPGPNTDLDYDLAIEQARSIFGRMFPGEEFLPRAPDPEEIAFDNQGTEPKQGDTFEGDDSAEGKGDGVEGQGKEAEKTEQVLEVKEQTEKEQEKEEIAKEQGESEEVKE
ncbi:rab proteins geranylgeranyltransferase component A-like [Scylla paramamosain]|uniref:rab proteins geranylgeranyltransferase component A-like n=1 Tax=Scylla paramamosain TaxID=85552 RepID=UPI003083372B